MRGFWLAALMMAGALAGCLASSGAGSSMEPLAFVATYETEGDGAAAFPTTIRLGGPMRIRDRDDIFRQAYVLDLEYADFPVLNVRMHVDADGHVVRRDGCFENDATTCFRPGVHWGHVGMRPPSGALWPWLLGIGPLPAEFPQDQRHVDVQAGGRRIVVADETFVFEPGKPVVSEVHGPHLSVRLTDLRFGDPLPPIDAWPLQVPESPKANAIMFPGEGDDLYNWGYTHLQALDGLRALDSGAVGVAIDAGCLLEYFSDAKHLPASEDPLRLVSGDVIAHHGFVYLDGQGAWHFEYLESHRTALGFDFKRATGFGYSHNGPHACPAAGQVGPNYAAGNFHDRVVAIFGPSFDDYDFRFWVRLPDGAQPQERASYAMQDFLANPADPIVNVFGMDATNGLWHVITFTQDSPGLIDNET